MRYLNLIIVVIFISGCSYNNPYILLNSSNVTILAITPEQEASILPNEKDTFYSLHGIGMVILEGTQKYDYTETVIQFVQDKHWVPEIFKRMCNSKIKLQYKGNGELEVVSCNKELENLSVQYMPNKILKQDK